MSQIEKYYEQQRISILYNLFYADDVTMADLLIKNGANTGSIDFTQTVLQSHLAQKGEMVKLLISSGANLNVADDENASTMLHHAVLGGENSKKFRRLDWIKANLCIFKEFLSNHNETNWCDVLGNVTVATLLIQNGFDINAIREDNKTSLDIAIEQGWSWIILCKFRFQYMSIFLIFHAGKDKMAEFLIENGAKMDDKTSLIAFSLAVGKSK